MENYRFAALDGDDIDDVRRLESALAAKYGRNILVIAYEQAGTQQQESSLSAGVEDDAALTDAADNSGQYSLEQTQMETGYSRRW
ncbi:MAG TPA: hypothetical protein GXZ82_08105 [Firmicutes bacterium]|jgi:hypothetical protein|nr:hypothetical protein [Bacillota bacterium]